MRSVLAGLRRLVIPWGAGGDQPRVVIGGDIPDSLQSYLMSFPGNVQSVINARITHMTPQHYFFEVLTVAAGHIYVFIRGVFDETIPQAFLETFVQFDTAAGVMAMGVSDVGAFFTDITAGSELALSAGGHIRLTPAPAESVLITQSGTDPATVGGRVATSIEDSNGPDFTTSETVIGTITGVVRSGSVYAVTCNASIRGDTAGDLVACRIREDSLAGPQRQRGYVVIGSASSVRSFDVPLYYQFTASATGSKTFVVTADRVAGSGNISRRAAPDEPQITHLDLIQ